MRWFIVALLVGLVGGCAKVAITGREQLSIVSDAKLAADADLIFAAYQANWDRRNAVVQGWESPEARMMVDTVNRVGQRIVDAAGLSAQRRWEFHVVKSSIPNAFALPNGKIVVLTGLMPLAQNDAGLAAILGHEVGHVVARHTAERMSQVLLGRVVQAGAAVALSRSNNAGAPLIAAALGMGMQYGVMLPYSRLHESEADHIGILLAAKAGYDPAEAIALWQRMEARERPDKSEFAATHPSAATRVAQLREWLPEAMVYVADRNRPLPTNLAELSAPRTERADAAALAPLGEKPAWEDGFTYRVRRSDRGAETTLRRERRTACPAGSACLALVSDADEESIYTEDLALLEVGSAAARTRFDPPLITARWPLRVGDSWTQTVSLNTGSASRSGTFKGEVVAYEAVSVPAGSFDAFKIVLTANGARFSEIWWAPEAGLPVRAVAVDGKGGLITRELTAYPRDRALPGIADSQ
jgi:Zn-dependent protease with chaperone function